MRRVSVVFLAAVLLTASMASASIWVRPTASGPGDWGDPLNWDVAVPLASDTVTIVGQAPNNMAEAQVTDAQTFGTRLRLGNNNPGAVIRVMNGGDLSAGPSGTRSYIGDSFDAQMIIDAGGIVTHNHRLYVGENVGVTGTLDISGTLNMTRPVGGNLYVGNDGVGLVNILDGGIVNLMVPGNLKLVGAAGSKLDIVGTGKIVFPGKVLGTAEPLLPSIYGDGILGGVHARYDSVNDVTLIKVPEPVSGMLLLIGAASMLYRRRK